VVWPQSEVQRRVRRGSSHVSVGAPVTGELPCLLAAAIGLIAVTLAVLGLIAVISWVL